MSDKQPERSALSELARSLIAAGGEPSDDLARRVADLPVPDQADLALRLPHQQRLAFLLSSGMPMRVVRSLPDADLYLTVRELGPIDALPLIKLASNTQLQHVVDLESWRKDRFDAARSGAWIATFLEAGEPALRRFLRHADDDLLKVLLRQWIRVTQIEYEDGADVHGHGMGDAGTKEGLLTPDGYHQFIPVVAEHGPAIQRLLQLFYEDESQRYRRVMWDSMYELPGEIEEEALRWRQSRLEEHGFPPIDEALSIYAPPQNLPRVSGNTTADEKTPAASRVALMPAERATALSRALEALHGPALERALHGTMSLANHIVVADAQDPGDPVAHREALDKAASYVGIALEARGAQDPLQASRLLTEQAVTELFREGFEHAAALRRQAREWVEQGWTQADPRALDLLDSPIQDRIRGLLQPRPHYYQISPDDQDDRWRDFRSLGEIEETRVALEMAQVVGRILHEELGLDIVAALDAQTEREHAPRFSSFVLTLLAWHAARSELRGDPLPEEVVGDFLRSVASRRTAAPDAPERALEMLVRRMAERYGLSPRDLSVLRGFGRFCLELLASQCANLDPGVPADPRFVSCLIMSGPIAAH